MKINKVFELDGRLAIELEGYQDIYPAFPLDTKAEDLPTLLKAWKVNQDEVDAINAQAKLEPVIVPVLSASLKALEGTAVKRR